MRGGKEAVKPLKGFTLPTVKGMIGLADDVVETFRRRGSARFGADLEQKIPDQSQILRRFGDDDRDAKLPRTCSRCSKSKT
jgi:hypothetical protein